MQISHQQGHLPNQHAEFSLLQQTLYILTTYIFIKVIFLEIFFKCIITIYVNKMLFALFWEYYHSLIGSVSAASQKAGIRFYKRKVAVHRVCLTEQLSAIELKQQICFLASIHFLDIYYVFYVVFSFRNRIYENSHCFYHTFT